MPTTSPDNISYPDSSGSSSIWTHIQSTATSVQAALTAMVTHNSWTLAWDTSGGGGFTSVGGSGTSQGFYSKIGTGSGALVHAEFRVELASGFSVDTGTFVLMLPVAAYVWGGSSIQATLGTWTARDDSVPYHYSGSLGIYQASSDRVSFNGAPKGSPSTISEAVSRNRIDSNDPIAWAAGDVLSGVLRYRAA